MITQDLVKSVLNYCPETGILTWRKSPRPGWVGKPAGMLTKYGYVRVQLGKRKYMAHRLIWLYVYGYEPPHEIDHVNGDRADNRLCNLREATRAENMQNKRRYRNNTSGLVGATWSQVRRKWAANIQTEGRQVNLGFYDTPEEARAAYLSAKAEQHQFQPTPRSGS